MAIKIQLKGYESFFDKATVLQFKSDVVLKLSMVCYNDVGRLRYIFHYYLRLIVDDDSCSSIEKGS